MLNLVAVLIVICSVIGGFYLANGPMHILLQPIEFLIICGCAFGAFLLSNTPGIIIDTFKQASLFIKGNKYNKEYYTQSIMLLHDLKFIQNKSGNIELEKHLEDSAESHIFQNYPKILNDKYASQFVVDNLNMITSNNFEPHVIQQDIETEIKLHHKHQLEPSHALQSVADAMPGLGIVAAVLGIINTMQYLDASNAEIGHHIGVALVGTFAGLYIAYGFLAPCATKLKHIADEEKNSLQVIQACLMAFVYNYKPDFAVEIARKYIPPHAKPSVSELEDKIQESKDYFKNRNGG